MVARQQMAVAMATMTHASRECITHTELNQYRESIEHSCSLAHLDTASELSAFCCVDVFNSVILMQKNR